MKEIKYVIILAVLVLIYSCKNCELWGDFNLGGEFTLLEGDKINDRAIIYCVGRKSPTDCCSGGIPIIPSSEESNVDYVESAKFDDRWIIVKSLNLDKGESFWIIDKNFDTNWEYDDGGVFYNRIQNHVIGPFIDIEKFEYQLMEKGIHLRFEK